MELRHRTPLAGGIAGGVSRPVAPPGGAPPANAPAGGARPANAPARGAALPGAPVPDAGDPTLIGLDMRDREAAALNRCVLVAALDESAVAAVTTSGLADRCFDQDGGPACSRADGPPERSLPFDGALQPRPMRDAVAGAVAAARPPARRRGGGRAPCRSPRGHARARVVRIAA